MHGSIDGVVERDHVHELIGDVPNDYGTHHAQSDKPYLRCKIPCILRVAAGTFRDLDAGVGALFQARLLSITSPLV